MKTSTLLKSSLLAAALLLAGTSVAQAGSAYTIIVRDGDFHPYAHDYHIRSCRHTPDRHTGHRHFRDYGHDGHGKPHGMHHSGSRERGDKPGYTGRWHHGRSDDSVAGGRHGQRSRSAGIGYTGRS